jgi:hypothetical protein
VVTPSHLAWRRSGAALSELAIKKLIQPVFAFDFVAPWP